jgi:desulfoferrodoxin-like iron-binding protein
MSDLPQKPPPGWNLGDWEKVLTIHVGAAYGCRKCGNLVMVTRGGIGTLELTCCREPMEKIAPRSPRKDRKN